MFDQIESVRDALESCAKACEPGRYRGEDALEIVKLLEQIERLAAATKLRFAKRVEESRLHERTGHRNASSLVGAATGESAGKTAARLEFATVLAENPELDDAYSSGKISQSQAAEIASVVASSPEAVPDLIEEADDISLGELKRKCAEVRSSASGEDEAARYDRIHRSRYLRAWTDHEGAGHLDARLTPDALAIVLSCLEPHTRKLFDQARREGRREPRSAYAADALVAMAKASIWPRSGAKDATGDNDDPTGHTEDQTGDRDGAPGPKPVVRITVDLKAVIRGHAAEGETCIIPGIDAPIPVSLVLDMIPGAILELLVKDGVDVTTVVTNSRHIKTALAIALDERDKFCCVPGCESRAFLENDHWQQRFADGGETSYANIARLCSRHHYLKTHKGFELRGYPGRWRFVPPGAPPDDVAPPERPSTARSGTDPPDARTGPTAASSGPSSRTTKTRAEQSLFS